MANLLPEPRRSALIAQRGPLPDGLLDFVELITNCPDDHLASGRVITAADIASHLHTGADTCTPTLSPSSHGNEVAMAYCMNLVTGLVAGEVTRAACRGFTSTAYRSRHHHPIEGYNLTEGTCGSCANPPAAERRPESIDLPMA